MPKHISVRRLLSYWRLYLFVLPAALTVGIFSYFPAASAIYHAFFRWNGSYVKEFVGLYNFYQLLGWSPFLWLVMVIWVVLLMAILVERPIWLARFAPAGLAFTIVLLGLFFLFAKGKSGFFDGNAEPVWGWYGRVFGSTIIGLFLHRLIRKWWSQWVQGFLILYGFLWFFYQSMMLTGDKTLWTGFGVIFVLVLANLVKMVPSIVTAVFIHRLKNDRWQYIYRVLFVVPMIVPAMVGLLVWKSFYDPTQGILNRVLIGTGFIDVLVFVDGIFDWGVFRAGVSPSWLGDAELVIPSLIFWGFPWVGTVGVLIYLTGLASIDESVYEAAELDNASTLQKFFYIELPLILTQVRINLVLMIIGTLQTYGQILILLGDSGGPRGVALVPGLYMFRSAFVELYAGKACAIGIIVFFFILLLTEINNRFVRVEK